MGLPKPSPKHDPLSDYPPPLCERENRTGKKLGGKREETGGGDLRPPAALRRRVGVGGVVAMTARQLVVRRDRRWAVIKRNLDLGLCVWFELIIGEVKGLIIGVGESMQVEDGDSDERY